MSTHATAPLVAALHAMPAWADVGRGNRAGLRAIEMALRAIKFSDAASLLDGIERCMAECDASPAGFDVSAMSKLFVANRWWFEVPAQEPSGRAGYGGFLGTPVAGGKTDALWPWSRDAAGRLRLSGWFAGYSGDSFLALEEARDFLQRYGLRQSRLAARR